MAILTNDFLKQNKVNNKYQDYVMYCGTKHLITNITNKNIMIQQWSKLNRGNCGRFNSGRHRIANNENATQWYLENRIIE